MFIAFRLNTSRMRLIPLVYCQGFIAMLAINRGASTSTAMLSTSTKKCQNQALDRSCGSWRFDNCKSLAAACFRPADTGPHSVGADSLHGDEPQSRGHKASGGCKSPDVAVKTRRIRALTYPARQSDSLRPRHWGRARLEAAITPVPQSRTWPHFVRGCR